MSESKSPTFQPRSEFVPTENVPVAYALVALNGTDTLRCHNLSSTALSALRDVFAGELRLYGEHAENKVAEFVLKNSPWSAKNVRSETLITNIFAVLLVHQYAFLTSIDYGRQYLDKLSLTFTRPSSVSNPALATESIFALSFTAPTLLRIIAAPLHATPAILQAVRGAWPRGVKSERKLGNGSWEFRLKGFGYFSPEKSDEAVLPHVFTLLRSLDAHAFKLLAAVPIGGRSRTKDLWMFSVPGPSKPGVNSPGTSVQDASGSGWTTSPYQATLESESSSPGPFAYGHARYATDEPERALPIAGAHAKSASLPGGYRKPAPAFVPSPSPKAGPMPMPVPMIPQPAPPSSSPLSPTSPMPPVSASHNSGPAPVPVPIPMKRNSSLLRKFRAGGRTASGAFRHPPPPPGFSSGTETGKERRSLGKGRRSLVSGEIIYETPPPGSKAPSPNPLVVQTGPSASSQVVQAGPVSPGPGANGFVPPPPPPPLSPVAAQSPTSPTAPIPHSPIVVPPETQVAPAPASDLIRPGLLSANHTTEELLLPRGTFRDSAFSTSTDQSHDVAVLWTGALEKTGDLEGVNEGEEEAGSGGEVEAHSPDVTRTVYEDARPKSERAELALAAPPLPTPAPETQTSGQEKQTAGQEKQVLGHEKKPSNAGTPNEWVFVSVDKGPGGSESSGSPPLNEPGEEPPRTESPPPMEHTRKGSFRRWFGSEKPGKPKTKVKPTRRRGAMATALRSSKRLTIE